MNEKEINENIQKIKEFLRKREIKEAHQQLLSLLGEKGDWELRNRLEKVQTSYQYMLQYMRQGIEDPERDKLYERILQDTWNITNHTRINLLEKISQQYYYEMRRAKDKFLDSTLYDWLRQQENYLDDLAVKQLMPNNEEEVNELMNEHNAVNKCVFMQVWSNAAWTADDFDDAIQFLISEQLMSHDRCLFVSAVTLSLLECFDMRKFIWLLTATTHENDEPSVQRALVGLALAFVRHGFQLGNYSDLEERIKRHDKEYQLGEKLQIIYLQLIRAQETEKINKHIQEDIIPGMIKKVEKFNKLNMEDLPDEEGFNPDWENAINDTEFENQLREMNDLQREGMDVNMSTFTHLKRFAFFNDLPNWFAPFDRNHADLVKVLGWEKKQPDTFLEMLLLSGLFCNSDKYSLCFLLNSMPASQRQVMLSNMTPPEMEDMLDNDHIEEMKKNAQRPVIISNLYIQDLYRFFELYPGKDEFYNPFKGLISLHNIWPLDQILNKPDFLKELANYRVKTEEYHEAISIYWQLKEQHEADAEVFQKEGYCYQKLNFYKDAIQAYQKAELLKPDNYWTNRQLATCYRMEHQYEKALEYYLKVEAVKPNQKSTILYIGNCLMQLKRYDEAMNRFFQLDLMGDNNVKVWRSIGWCSFLCGKWEQAKKYYDKVLQEAPNAVDYLNAGHIAWAMKNIDQAVTFYGKVALACDGKSSLKMYIEEDWDTLVNQGVPMNDLPLILDMI